MTIPGLVFLSILPSEPEMMPDRGRILCRLAALSMSLSAAGCYIPGGGWTMRAGVDVRCLKKPAAFVEVVDTRWDEITRVAELNALGAATVVTSPPVAPAAFTPATGPHLMEGVAVPPATDAGSGQSAPNSPPPRFPGNPAGNATGSDSTREEPGKLPATEEGSVAQTSGTRSARRPIASRLFSRPQ
jgi:hypothetical protein